MQIMDTPEQAIARALGNPDSAYARAVMAAQAEAADPPELTPHERVQKLEQQLAAAQDELDAAADAARQGDVEAARRANLPALAAHIAALQGELTVAREAEAEAEAVQHSQERRAQEAQFENSVARARASREAVRGLYRQLALELGHYCTYTESAVNLRNALSRFIPDPVRDAALSDVMNRAALDPKNELLDSGLQGVFGDLAITIPPLVERSNKS